MSARKLGCVGPFENLMDLNQGPFNDVSDNLLEHENIGLQSLFMKSAKILALKLTAFLVFSKFLKFTSKIWWSSF